MNVHHWRLKAWQDKVMRRGEQCGSQPCSSGDWTPGLNLPGLCRLLIAAGLLKGHCPCKCYCRYSLNNFKKSKTVLTCVSCRGSNTTAGGSQFTNLWQEPSLYSISRQARGAVACVCTCLFMFPQETHVSRNMHILNVCLLAGPQHKFALAEETVAKIRLYFFLFYISEV